MSFSRALTVALLLAPAMTQAQRTAKDSIARLDSAWARTYAVHDTALALALFAPDVVVVGGNGALKNREGELRDIRPVGYCHDLSRCV